MKKEGCSENTGVGTTGGHVMRLTVTCLLLLYISNARKRKMSSAVKCLSK